MPLRLREPVPEPLQPARKVRSKLRAPLRTAAGLTQANLAELAGPDMTVSRLKSLELGKVRRLTHADTAALAAALNVSGPEVRAAHQWDLDHARPAARAGRAADS